MKGGDGARCRQLRLWPRGLDEGWSVDLFAGGGGASTGVEAALGRSVDVAVNHDEIAIRTHEANHPHALHLHESVWRVDPLKVTQGRPVWVLWASPDCKHFSRAKGGVPRSKKIRSLANAIIRWAVATSPGVIFVENVAEFQTWGPLDKERAIQVRVLGAWPDTEHGYVVPLAPQTGAQE